MLLIPAVSRRFASVCIGCDHKGTTLLFGGKPLTGTNAVGDVALRACVSERREGSTWFWRGFLGSEEVGGCRRYVRVCLIPRMFVEVMIGVNFKGLSFEKTAQF